jgi:hypothetical protein
MIQLNNLDKGINELSDRKIVEVKGGALGGAIGSGQSLLRGQGMDKADKAGSVGQKIGAGVGAVAGGVVGGLYSAATGPFSLITAAPAIGTGAIGGGAVGASLSD